MSYAPPSFNPVANGRVGTPKIGNSSPPPGMGGRPVRSLVITTEAAAGVNGTTITTQPVVEVRNQLNQIISDSTADVTVEVLSGNALLTGTTTVAAVSGVATFTNLALDSTDGTPVTLVYRSVGAYPARSQASTAITYGAGNKAGIGTQPVGAASGAVLSVQPVIRILDVDGMLVANSTVNVVASKASGTGTLGGTLTVAAVAGVATFTNLTMTTAGSCVLRFTPTALTLIDSGTVVTT